MMMRTALLALTTSLIFATPALAQSPAATPSPTVELAVGFSGPVYETAEFPGFVGSVAWLFPIASNWGVGLVAEGEAAYLRLTRTAGARVYARGGRGSAFLQLVAGSAEGEEARLIHSTGGRVIQPGVGFSFGGRLIAFHAEFDYRSVKDGRIYDTRPGHPSVSQSGRRVVVGVTFRLRRR